MILFEKLLSLKIWQYLQEVVTKQGACLYRLWIFSYAEELQMLCFRIPTDLAVLRSWYQRALMMTLFSPCLCIATVGVVARTVVKNYIFSACC